MIYQEIPPSSDLRAFIKCFWRLSYERSPAAVPELVLPDGSPEIVFNLSDRFLRIRHGREEPQAKILLAGQMRSSILIRPSGNVDLFGVRFQPAGLQPMLSGPANDITDEIVELDWLVGDSVSEIEDMTLDTGSFAGRADTFEKLFRRRLGASSHVDRIAMHASQLIVHRDGQIRISKLCADIGISERSLERRFEKAIGISPKTLAKIVRFQNVVRRLNDGTSDSVLDAALDAGYYDQPHLIKEFKELSGETPAAFFERTHRLSDVFTGAA